MTAAARKQAAPRAIDVFRARAQARALLYAAGEMDLLEAVDGLWAAAVRDGLVISIGADAVQAILSTAFAAVREAES
jgi:hypothetical protein